MRTPPSALALLRVARRPAATSASSSCLLLRPSLPLSSSSSSSVAAASTLVSSPVASAAAASTATPKASSSKALFSRDEALAPFIPPAEWSAATKDRLAMLRAQRDLRAIVEIKQRPYFVAVNDVIITMRMNDLSLGDVIVLDRVREISSEDYILQGHPYVFPSFFTIKAVVVEHPVSAEIVRHHWKKRGHQPVHVNRNHHTALRISEISISKL
ncbi:hypothetical protein HDU84_000856 [Entophlyctis sp. JEL0112]|nr:hypothetical protein HDU84_000856 [Entophlyctis sp. JEL0112]